MKSLCRFCHKPLAHTFVDLGVSPLCQSHVTPERAQLMEPFYPLLTRVCEHCWLVQLDQFVAPDDIFGAGDYAYFSSFSDSWVEHARNYAEAMCQRFNLHKNSKVVEIASNDGYLLQWFKAMDIPVLGIEPASNCAEVAINKGIDCEIAFFGLETAQRLLRDRGAADLLLGNNVLAHVPDINDFVAGMKTLLSADGVITMEFPHLMQLVNQNQYDTIYHEHFSYLSFNTVKTIFESHGLALFDVEQLHTHGGSLRIYAQHIDCKAHIISRRVKGLLDREISEGLRSLDYYDSFTERVKENKRGLLSFLIDARRAGKSIVGYGAPGKGNTLLNYCGIRTDFIDYTVDRSPHKQGNYLPGSRIPIAAPEKIFESKPDYVLILPWNLKTEIMEQMAGIRQWGGKFLVPIPELQVCE